MSEKLEAPVKHIILAIVFLSFAAFAKSPYAKPLSPSSEHWTEGASLLEKLNKKYELELMLEKLKVRAKNDDLKLRSVDYYRNTIFLKFDPPFGLKELRAGTLPYFVQGDFDCDKKQDKAVILSDDKTHIQMATGSTLTIDFGGDAIALAKPGKRKTIRGKGYEVESSDPMPAHFEAECDFLEGIYWEKSAVAYVYDKDKKKFIEYYTAD